MTTASKKVLGMVLLCCALSAIQACSRSPRHNFYTLTATASREETAMVREMPSISVEAITLPEFVDRPQLVIVNPDNRVDILEMHQWAESLKSAIPRVIAGNLSRQLGTDRVSAYPQHAGLDAAYRVAIDFQSFESTSDGIAIDALWTVRAAGGSVSSGRSRVRESRKDGLDTVASAYSRALAAVSADIALVMKKELPASP